MMSPKARLILAASLFVAWIGWLAYLVVQTRDPVILSRPQFLVADLYVIARLTADDGKPAKVVTVEDMLWAAPNRQPPAKGATITVENLSECGSRQGWQGEGLYLLALSRTSRPDTEMLKLIPPSPGYAPINPTDRLRIYPATEDAIRQVREIIAAKVD